ncbi:MAG: hypothetical protein WAZ18_06980 [Alphaproteobacteria bacterium]
MVQVLRDVKVLSSNTLPSAFMQGTLLSTLTDRIGVMRENEMSFSDTAMYRVSAHYADGSEEVKVVDKKTLLSMQLTLTL